MIKERIDIKNIDGQLFEIKIVEPDNSKPASFTHYLHNHKNGLSHFYKKDALSYVKEILEKEYPTEKITNKVAEEALQYLIFDLKKTVPFPAPKNPKFKFIDLFAGIGGFRLAFQNLEGKCVFTSEWDKYSKQTYKANFGEIPFGDITKPATKNYIPDNFDVLCAGFPCQAFSIAGRRGGFEDTRGTLFFDVAEIIKKKQPKAIFLENVKGLRNHDKGKTLITILNVLREDLNYYVPEPQILNAKEYGVPQNRERVLFIGCRKDQKFISEMKLRERQAIAFVHRDKKHTHIHLYVNRIGFDGKAYKDSFIGKRSQHAAERVANEMGLTTVREVQREKLNELKRVRAEIKEAHEKVMKEMKPRDFDLYIKCMLREQVKVIPSINRQNQLQGFRFEYKGHNLKGSEVHRSMSGSKLALQITADPERAIQLQNGNAIRLSGKTIELSTNLATNIAKRVLKLAIKRVMDQGIGI